MRSHLIKIFESNVIEHFPQDLNNNTLQKVLPLAIIKKREASATRARMKRQKEKEQQKANRLQKNREFKELQMKNKNEHENQEVSKIKKSTEIEQIMLSLDQKEIIVQGGWLNDEHMDYFNQFLKNCSDYKPEETWKLQRLEYIKPIPEDKKHIQILHSTQHWICSYYDRKNLFIYDSLNKKELHSDHEKFLRQLFPTYPFNERPVKFPTVQKQPNGNDCGVFAIAFAISLLFNIKPEKVRYDHSLMRSHLINIFESNMIEHFPQDLNNNTLQKVLPLAIIKKREALATRARMKHQKEEQQKANQLQKNREFKELQMKNKNEHENQEVSKTKKSTEIEQIMLSLDQKEIIVHGGWLNDEHMDYFNQFLKNCSDYKPEETWKLQRLEYIKPIPEDKKHIQILHSTQHWICSYYDRKNLFIYDSLNKKELHSDHEKFLRQLFPTYPFNERPVKFPTVQKQPNGNDCGVFAIAFAISLLFNIKPEKVRYDHSLMRSHLIKIFESNMIEHFPQDLNNDTL
ncbi:serine/threonine-protein kinase 10-like [Linepithema humile]|uniref:serine/threonine-protein kinase 10-like n=1 Tax=Linepithema humile TaxID=83485 RepID=UPI00351F77CE